MVLYLTSFLCLFKMLSSSKISISLVSVELAGASLLAGMLLALNNVNPMFLTLLLITMFVCEGVVGLVLLASPVMHGGPSPRELSAVLF
nr:NADH dehydrogenase subunit 4L [Hoplopleura pacifica]